MGTAQTTFEEVVLSEDTWPDITWVTSPEVTWLEDVLTGSMLCTCSTFSPRFFLTRVVVQVPWLPEATEGRVTLFGGPLCMCMRNRKLRNICPMGPFDRKWRYETSPRSDLMSCEPFGVPLGVRNLDRKCPWGVLKDVRVLYLAWLP
jgi:hypothetical protein